MWPRRGVLVNLYYINWLGYFDFRRKAILRAPKPKRPATRHKRHPKCPGPHGKPLCYRDIPGYRELHNRPARCRRGTVTRLPAAGDIADLVSGLPVACYILHSGAARLAAACRLSHYRLAAPSFGWGWRGENAMQNFEPPLGAAAIVGAWGVDDPPEARDRINFF